MRWKISGTNDCRKSNLENAPNSHCHKKVLRTPTPLWISNCQLCLRLIIYWFLVVPLEQILLGQKDQTVVTSNCKSSGNLLFQTFFLLPFQLHPAANTRLSCHCFLSFTALVCLSQSRRGKANACSKQVCYTSQDCKQIQALKYLPLNHINSFVKTQAFSKRKMFPVELKVFKKQLLTGLLYVFLKQNKNAHT